MNTNADLFLAIARHHFDLLKAVPRPIVLGSDPSEHSDHFRLAIVCSVFSAFAVEHAMSELIWARTFLQTPEPYRSSASLQARSTRTIPAKLDLLRRIANVDESLLRDLKQLFEYRNRVAHADIESFDGMTLEPEDVDRINAAGRGAELDAAIGRMLYRNDSGPLDELKEEFGRPTTHLMLPGISTDDIEAAPRHLEVAEKATAVLREQMNQEWPQARSSEQDEP